MGMIGCSSLLLAASNTSTYRKQKRFIESPRLKLIVVILLVLFLLVIVSKLLRTRMSTSTAVKKSINTNNSASATCFCTHCKQLQAVFPRWPKHEFQGGDAVAHPREDVDAGDVVLSWSGICHARLPNLQVTWNMPQHAWSRLEQASQSEDAWSMPEHAWSMLEQVDICFWKTWVQTPRSSSKCPKNDVYGT